MVRHRMVGSVVALVLAVHPVSQFVCATVCTSVGELESARVGPGESSPDCHGD